MIFLKYKQPKAEYVQFQRLVFGLIILVSVLYQRVEFVYAFLLLSIVSFLTTTYYSPTTLLFRLINFIFAKPLFTTAPQYAHSYITYRLTEIFEDILRIIGAAVVLFLYTLSPLAAWMMASVMGVAMLISSFFGFCVSSLLYIGYKKMMEKLRNPNE